jgi:hypothetical protein
MTVLQKFYLIFVKGLSILTGYKLPREWNEPCAWHEINLATKFPVTTDVPEPRRKLRRLKKQGAFVSLRHDISMGTSWQWHFWPFIRCHQEHDSYFSYINE